MNPDGAFTAARAPEPEVRAGALRAGAPLAKYHRIKFSGLAKTQPKHSHKCVFAKPLFAQSPMRYLRKHKRVNVALVASSPCVIFGHPCMNVRIAIRRKPTRINDKPNTNFRTIEPERLKHVGIKHPR